MIEPDDFEEILHRLKMHSSDLASVFLGEDDKKAVIFYSLGFLADMYGDAAEDLLKKGEDYAATYYSNKFTKIHQFCEEVFDDVPQKEYYHRQLTYKAVPYKTKMPLEQIQQFAQFAAANVQPDSEVLQDEHLLISEIKKLLKKHDRLGIEAKYVEVLRKQFKELINKPPKLDMVYELLLLLENIEMIQKMAREKEKEQKQQQREEESREKQAKLYKHKPRHRREEKYK